MGYVVVLKGEEVDNPVRWEVVDSTTEPALPSYYE